MSKRYRAGIIGTGMMGQLHADALNRLPAAVPVCMTGSNPEHLEEAARRYGIEKTYPSVEEMLAQEDLDSVHVCSSNQTHFEFCMAAIERGINVLCEKPLTITSKEGEALVKAAGEKNVVCAVNFNYRNNAMVREMQERVASGQAGKIYFIHGTYLQDWLMYDTDYSWRLDRSVNGPSRAIADIGSHLFDTIQCASGRRIKAVCCSAFTALEERKKPTQQVQTFAQNEGGYEVVRPDTEDGASIQFILEDGTPGAVIVSQVCGGHKNDLTLELECENYSMRWMQEDADKLWIGSRKEGKQVLYASPGTVSAQAAPYVSLPEGHAGNWRDALYNGIAHYYSVLSGAPRSLITDFADGTYIVRITEACLRSSQSRQWEEV